MVAFVLLSTTAVPVHSLSSVTVGAEALVSNSNPEGAVTSKVAVCLLLEPIAFG